MPRQPTVSAQMVQHLKKYMLGMGSDFGKICRKAGIPADDAVFTNPEARLFAGQYLSLFLESEKATGNPCFGLDLGREMARSYPGGSLAMGMMVNCPTVGEALDLFVRYHDLIADALRPCMARDGEDVRLGWNSAVADYLPPLQMAGTLLSLFAGILEHLGEGRIALQEVRFQYLAPDNLADYRERFKAPVIFGAPDSGLIIKEKYLALPVPLANPALLQTLQRFADKLLHRIYLSQTWSHRVAESLASRLIRGKPFDLDAMAGELGLSTRSLQGRLKEEGSTYRRILDHVRRETAMKALQDGDMTLCDIAFLLGFSEQSAFNRAFKRWTGSNPKACRPNGFGVKP